MAESDLTLKLTNNTSSLYRDDPSGTTDNVFTFVDADGRKITIAENKGIYILRRGGVLPGSNMLSRIQAILNHAEVREIVFDHGDITITGSLNCNNKKLKFRNKSKIIGTNTLDSGILDCPLSDQCFTSNTTLTNFKSTRREFSFENYGAIGNASNESIILQKTADTLIANDSTMPATIKLFRGKIYGTGGLVLYKWTGTNYTQFSINIIGEESAFGGQTACPTIKALNASSFGINVQRGAGVTIKGISVVSDISIANASGFAEFFGRPYSTFSTSAGARDSKNSPFSLIALDAFSNTTFVPDDGGFPDWNGSVTTQNPSGVNWYRGATGPNSGCTAITLHDITLIGATVGIIVSPNGLSQQCENLRFSDIYASSMKAVFGFCQRESKNCTIKGGYTIDRVHTVVDGLTWGGYGGNPGAGTIPDFDGWNQAGTVVRFINGTAQHTVSFKSIYMENVYQIGNMNTQFGRAMFINCGFGFCPEAPSIYAPSHFVGLNVSFNSCLLRYYDDMFNKRLSIEGQGISFTDCYFDLPPITCTGTDISGTVGGLNSTFDRCFFGLNSLGKLGFSEFRGSVPFYGVLPYGRIFYEKFQEEEAGTEGGKSTIEINTGNYEHVRASIDISWVHDITTRTATVTTYTDDITVGQYIMYSDGASTSRVLGRVTARTSAHHYNVADVPIVIANGAGSATNSFIVDYHRVKPLFIGTWTNGSNLITNILGDAPSVGEIDIYSKHVIDAYNAGTKVATLRDVYSGTSMTDVLSPMIDSGTFKRTFYKPGIPIDNIFNINYSSASNTTIYIKGDVWIYVPFTTGYSITSGTRKFVCIQSGYLFPIPLGKTNKAIFEEVFDSEIKQVASGSADFTVLVPNYRLIRGWELTPTADMTVVMSVTPGDGLVDPGTLALVANINTHVIRSFRAGGDLVIYVTGITGSGGSLTIKFF